MQQQNTRTLRSVALALIVAIGLLVFAVPNSVVNRFSNLNLEESEIRDTYLMHSKSNPDKAYVVNRRNSTMRRSDANQPGRMWEVYEIGGYTTDSSLSSWLVKSKRIGKGTVFFVPVEDVTDWVYPFLYQFVRQ